MTPGQPSRCEGCLDDRAQGSRRWTSTAGTRAPGLCPRDAIPLCSNGMRLERDF